MSVTDHQKSVRSAHLHILQVRASGAVLHDVLRSLTERLRSSAVHQELPQRKQKVPELRTCMISTTMLQHFCSYDSEFSTYSYVRTIISNCCLLAWALTSSFMETCALVLQLGGFLHAGVTRWCYRWPCDKEKEAVIQFLSDLLHCRYDVIPPLTFKIKSRWRKHSHNFG